MASKSQDKFVEEIGSMSVLELSELVKALEDKFGVSAAMPVAAAAPVEAPAAAAVEEKSEFKITLKDVGAKKIDVIKAVKKITGWALTEAKKAVEETPSTIADAAPTDKAKEIKEALEAAGATVELS